jgi:hypothetical protein
LPTVRVVPKENCWFVRWSDDINRQKPGLERTFLDTDLTNNDTTVTAIFNPYYKINYNL